MKLKTINSVICKKFDAWVDSIKDPKVQGLVRENTICTGGAIASMLLNEEVNDFDFYFRDYETTMYVAEYYVDLFGHDEIVVKVVDDLELKTQSRIKIIVPSSGVTSDPEDETEDKEEDEKQKPFHPVFLSANAISLSDDVQIVTRFYGDPDQIHANYDYVHVTNYWTSWGRKVMVNEAALLSLLNKDLRYIGSRYPLCSLFRARKFIQRGWKITAGQILKIAVNLQKYNLLSLAVLEEQLTGVDVAYFADLISRLQENGSTGRVDEAYLAELIDRLF